MSWLGTIAGLLLLLIPLHAAGWALTGGMPDRLRPAARTWLPPLLGFALLIFVALPLGWFGPGFAHPVVRVGLLSITGGLIWLRRRDSAWLRSFVFLGGFLALASWPFTVQIQRFEAFDILNDPWTYCVQSEWLQTNSLSDSAPRDNAHGAQTQVYFTQLTGTRAGAQFVLALVQGMLGLNWAHQAYPIVMALAFGCGALVVAFATQIILRSRSRIIPGIVGLSVTSTLNGFSLGAMRGYYPQTVGLILGVTGGLLCGWMIARADRLSTAQRGYLGLLTGALLAGATYAYSEILPFLALGCAGVVLWFAFRHRQLRPLLWCTGTIVGAFLLLAGPELPRAVPALIGQSRSVVGEGIPWHFSDFLLHALGGRAGYTDGNLWLGDHRLAGLLAAALIGGLVLAGLGRRKPNAPSGILLAGGIILLLFTLFFVCFRFRVESPFVVGKGQSWSQYKLANWSSLWLFCFLGAGLVQLGRFRRIAVCALAGITVIGFVQAWSLADVRTSRLRAEVGVERAPFDTLTQFAAEVERTSSPPVFLDFAPSRAKSRQLLAYLLPMGTTTADWNDDVFVYWMLPHAERFADRGQASWIVNFEETPGGPVQSRLGNYRLAQLEHLDLPLLDMIDGYPPEIHPEGKLFWLRDRIRFEFLVPPGVDPAQVTMEAEVVSLVHDLSFTLSAQMGDWRMTETIYLPESHNAWESPPSLRRVFQPQPDGPERTISIELHTEQPPAVIGGTDTRELTFFVRNVRVWVDRPGTVFVP